MTSSMQAKLGWKKVSLTRSCTNWCSCKSLYGNISVLPEFRGLQLSDAPLPDHSVLSLKILLNQLFNCCQLDFSTCKVDKTWNGLLNHVLNCRTVGSVKIAVNQTVCK